MNVIDITNLDCSAEFSYLLSLLPESPPASKRLLGHGLIYLLWLHADDRANDEGRIPTSSRALDAYLGLPGASDLLFRAGYLTGSPLRSGVPSFVVRGWARGRKASR